MSEYGDVDSAGETHTLDEFVLESGRRLHRVPIRYRTWGKLNASKDNVVVVCHALTGNADVESWWGDILGPGKPFDVDKYLIVCANVLGSCYGTCGPTTNNPMTGQPYGGDFPLVRAVVGGSMGGMQALEWAFIELVEVPVRSIVAIACNGCHQPWQIGFSECQRQAVFADPTWKNGYYDADNPPYRGLEVARQIAMISYRTHNSYSTKFGRRITGGNESAKIEDRTVSDQWEQGSLEAQWKGEKQTMESFEVTNYLQYQGARFIQRKFDPNSYVVLTHLMDSHDVSRGRGEYTQVLNSIQQPILVLGIRSDVLYPIHEQQELRDYLGNADFHILESDEGHDGFLIEQEQVGRHLQRFLRRIEGESSIVALTALKADLTALQADLTALKSRL